LLAKLEPSEKISIIGVFMTLPIPTNLVATENCNGLPQETLLQILSYVGVKDLGRIACVSKELLRISEDNILWKTIYECRWTLPVEWIDEAPSKWKDYYLTVVKVRQFAPKDSENQTETSVFWSFGLPEESAILKPLQTTLGLQQASVMVAKGATLIVFRSSQESDPEFEEEPEISCSLSLQQRSAHSNPPNLDHAIKTRELTLSGNSESHRTFMTVFNILYLLRTAGRIKAQEEFLKERKQLETYSRLLGWWLSEIVNQDLYQKNDSLRVTFPAHTNPDKKETRDFLQGFFLMWLKHGEATTHFNTLRALRKLAHENKESGSEEAPKGLFLEELIIWTLCRNNALSNLEKLANLYLHFPHRLSTMTLINHPWTEELPDGDERRAGELEKAAFLYLRTLRLYHPQRTPVQLAVKLSLAWIQLKQIGNNTTPEERALLLPPSIFQAAVNHHERLRIKDLDTMAHFTALFQVKPAYPFMGACLKWIQFPSDEKTLEQTTSLYCTKVFFYRKTGNFVEALYAWIDLCLFLEWERKAKVDDDFDLYGTIYSILNTSKQICEKMVSTQSKLPPVKLAIAYALYRLDRIDESLRMTMEIAPCFNKRALQWLSALSQVDFRAVVIYSLCLDKVAELEHYYLEEMLDYYPEQRFYIYHNLATRIYFLEKSEEESDADLEEIKKALEYAEEADAADPHQPETHILTGLCYSFNGDHEEGQHEIKMGVALCPEKFSQGQQFSQEQLLIFPVKKS
jgi:hypothetical protein